MNCLEFRRHCLIDPLSRDAGFREHSRDCPACRTFLQAQLDQEQRLRAAIAIEPPPDLAARILLRQSFAHRARGPLAIAATVLLSTLAGLMGYFATRAPSLESEVLAHIHAERDHLTSETRENPGKVAMVLEALGARVEGMSGDVRYAGVCDISKRPGAHLVLRGRHGPVTVLLLPHQATSQRTPIHDEQLEGVILPIRGGSVALVGNRGEDMDALARQLRVQFSDPRV